MKHRKQSHPLDISVCRFYQDTGYCKFENQCYYKHSEGLSHPQVFPKSQVHPPPDPPMMDLIVMLKEMMATYMHVKEKQSDKNRPLGN